MMRKRRAERPPAAAHLPIRLSRKANSGKRLELCSLLLMCSTKWWGMAILGEGERGVLIREPDLMEVATRARSSLEQPFALGELLR
jgi:hypothetical protein